jgi:hypothetical protein
MSERKQSGLQSDISLLALTRARVHPGKCDLCVRTAKSFAIVPYSRMKCCLISQMTITRVRT